MEDARIQMTMKIPTQRILIDSRQSWQAAMKIPIMVMKRNKAVKISEIRAQIVVAWKKWLFFNFEIKEEKIENFVFFCITYDEELFTVEFDSEDAHDSDEKCEKGASISRCPES